ncbi:MAG: DNA translocase FtsK, partial [Planctomycetes bacterium]|nr:DNA translocase FtsK [Planctomycetota bacterium]
SNLVRCQGTFVSDDEVRKLVRHVTHVARPQFDEELGGMSAPGRRKNPGDDLYEEAVRTVLETGRGSTSLLQRKFQIGYTRAARLVDLMAQEGILGKYKGSQAREVLVSLEEWEKANARAGK